MLHEVDALPYDWIQQQVDVLGAARDRERDPGARTHISDETRESSRPQVQPAALVQCVDHQERGPSRASRSLLERVEQPLAIPGWNADKVRDLLPRTCLREVLTHEKHRDQALARALLSDITEQVGLALARAARHEERAGLRCRPRVAFAEIDEVVQRAGNAAEFARPILRAPPRVGRRRRSPWQIGARRLEHLR